MKKYQLKFRILKTRAKIIQAVRSFFTINGYLEIETPLRIPAPVPEANIELFQSEGWYLQASPEVCMKRLAAHGFSKIFQICKCFRKDERSDRHLTELTMLEWYTKDNTYVDLMNQCQELIQYIAAKICHNEKKKAAISQDPKQRIPSMTGYAGAYADTKADIKTKQKLKIIYNGNPIDLSGQWQRLTVKQTFSKYGSVSMEKALSQNSFDYTMGFEIEPNLGQSRPTFIFDYPSSFASLAKLKSQDKKIAERFELYIAGIELANGFSELTDPVEQKKRFEEELELRKKAGGKITPLPEKFIEDLKSLPETAGIALGIDRLVMLFTDSASIDNVVAFTPEDL